MTTPYTFKDQKKLRSKETNIRYDT